MNQVHAFFKKSLESEIPLDLIPDNLRVNEDGTVALIDFVEHMGENGKLKLFIEKAITDWSTLFAENNSQDRNKTEEFLKKLLFGLDRFGYDDKYIQEKLGEVIFVVSNIGGKQK